MQHLPFPGQTTFLSISSHKSAKNPVTQVPRQFPSLCSLFLGGFVRLNGLRVVVVEVVVLGGGATGSGGALSLSGIIKA
jgi:hypothetical protein